MLLARKFSRLTDMSIGSLKIKNKKSSLLDIVRVAENGIASEEETKAENTLEDSCENNTETIEKARVSLINILNDAKNSNGKTLEDCKIAQIVEKTDKVNTTEESTEDAMSSTQEGVDIAEIDKDNTKDNVYQFPSKDILDIIGEICIPIEEIDDEKKKAIKILYTNGMDLEFISKNFNVSIEVINEIVFTSDISDEHKELIEKHMSYYKSMYPSNEEVAKALITIKKSMDVSRMEKELEYISSVRQVIMHYFESGELSIPKKLYLSDLITDVGQTRRVIKDAIDRHSQLSRGLHLTENSLNSLIKIIRNLDVNATPEERAIMFHDKIKTNFVTYTSLGVDLFLEKLENLPE